MTEAKTCRRTQSARGQTGGSAGWLPFPVPTIAEIRRLRNELGNRPTDKENADA